MVNLGNEIPEDKILPTKDQVNALDTVGFFDFFPCNSSRKKKKKKRLNVSKQ